MKKCPFCGGENPDNAVFCNHCGETIMNGAPGTEGHEHPQTYQTNAYQNPNVPEKPLNGADVCAIIGFILVFVDGSLLSLILCIIGLGGNTKAGLAKAGIIISIIEAIITLIIIFAHPINLGAM